MLLIIKNRDTVLFQGEVETVTSYNKTGIFNILKDHANFICVVEKKVVFTQRGATREIPVDNGLLKVRENKVSVYLGIK
jgi:F0F1-type ATP synthase epsilon subunit